ncbi:hypothetical protein [Meiothermus ruber]|uniref:Uncharacterized protein n=1 Tax=Meiothermus ruber (strain ATCC 35948 / DSM 1279 / VKM B-1258 / 21) TaxID=504728 RepID=M9XBD0_MEIRD|nr:hypothetical protein [Meiothermus ruber]AGK05826.1 hypothetical protein K649_12700 [Meiothermus ruber DSM 1279]
MERLDRIEAQIESLREELRGLRLAHTIAHDDLSRTLQDVREALAHLQIGLRPPRKRVWLALTLAAIGFGLGFTAHWRISQEEVSHVRPVLSPRAPLQDLQQPAAR